MLPSISRGVVDHARVNSTAVCGAGGGTDCSGVGVGGLGLGLFLLVHLGREALGCLRGGGAAVPPHAANASQNTHTSHTRARAGLASPSLQHHLWHGSIETASSPLTLCLRCLCRCRAGFDVADDEGAPSRPYMQGTVGGGGRHTCCQRSAAHTTQHDAMSEAVGGAVEHQPQSGRKP